MILSSKSHRFLGIFLNCLVIQFHCHRSLKELHAHDQTALLGSLSHDNAHRSRQGAIDHPHLLPLIQITPGIIELVRHNDGLDGIHFLRNNAGGLAVAQDPQYMLLLDDFVVIAEFELVLTII